MGILDTLAAQGEDVYWGEVTGTSPLTVRPNGDSNAITGWLRNADYSPTVGDTVVLQRVGTRWAVAYRYT